MKDLFSSMIDPLLDELVRTVAEDPDIGADVRNNLDAARLAIKYKNGRYPDIPAMKAIIDINCDGADPSVRGKLLAIIRTCLRVIDDLNVLTCFDFLKILDETHTCPKHPASFRDVDGMRYFVADTLKDPATEARIERCGMPRKKREQLAVLTDQVVVQYSTSLGTQPESTTTV